MVNRLFIEEGKNCFFLLMGFRCLNRIFTCMNLFLFCFVRKFDSFEVFDLFYVMMLYLKAVDFFSLCFYLAVSWF